jgi:hypothetical protein
MVRQDEGKARWSVPALVEQAMGPDNRPEINRLRETGNAHQTEEGADDAVYQPANRRGRRAERRFTRAPARPARRPQRREWSRSPADQGEVECHGR